MPAAQRSLSTGTFGDLTVGELLELAQGARGQRLERHLLAATLRALAAWLAEQARLLLEADVSVSNVRALQAVDVSAPPMLLTRREREVARCIARGLSNRQIAAELVITTSTTERHVANILSKLSMRSRAQVAAWAASHGVA
jgi:DNA-binding NarL/FixJ family response regulator